MNTFCFSYKIKNGYIQVKVTSALPCPNPGDTVWMNELFNCFITVVETTETSTGVYHIELASVAKNINGTRFYFHSNGNEGMV